MTPSQKKAINGSATMQVLIRAMQEDGESITFKSHHRLEATGDCRAQIRTENMVFDWIVTARGRIVHEDYTIMDQRIKDLMKAAA